MKKFNKVYVLYANEKYFDIVSMAAKSIREFSNLPIIVYLLNYRKKYYNIGTCYYKNL